MRMRSVQIDVDLGRRQSWLGFWCFHRPNQFVPETRLRIWRVTFRLIDAFGWFVEFRLHR